MKLFIVYCEYLHFLYFITFFSLKVIVKKLHIFLISCLENYDYIMCRFTNKLYQKQINEIDFEVLYFIFY